MVALVGVACGSSAEDEAAIRETFQRYKRALLDARGGDAAGLVTSETIAFYEETSMLALEAPEPEVRERPIVDRLQVLTLRHRMSAAQLRSMSGRDLFAYAVDEGLIGAEQVQTLDIGEIEVEGDTASGAIVTGAQEVDLARWRFVRQEGRWRLDLLALFPLTELALEQAADDAGLEVDELLVQALEISSGERVSPDIWQPLDG